MVASSSQQQQLGSFEELVRIGPPRRVRCYDFTTSTQRSPVDYHAAWQLQKQLLQQHLDFAKNITNHTMNENDPLYGITDTIVLLEHAPVYTLGTASDAAFVLADKHPAVPVVRIDRGGEVTYHGPGQLTVYPILDLRARYRADLHWYLRALEEVILRVLQRRLHLPAYREDGVTGLWVDNVKVAAVGVKCHRAWITQHGVALSVTPESLRYTDGIVPCGLVGRKVGCVQQFLPAEERDEISVAEMAVYVRAALEEVLHIQLIDAELPPL